MQLELFKTQSARCVICEEIKRVEDFRKNRQTLRRQCMACESKQSVRRIESQFTDGMSWDNYGEWHIDHVIPKNLFDPNDSQQLQQCWALNNLRPLWASENLSRPRDGSDVLFYQ